MVNDNRQQIHSIKGKHWISKKKWLNSMLLRNSIQNIKSVFNFFFRIFVLFIVLLTSILLSFFPVILYWVEQKRREFFASIQSIQSRSTMHAQHSCGDCGPRSVIVKHFSTAWFAFLLLVLVIVVAWFHCVVSFF